MRVAVDKRGGNYRRKHHQFPNDFSTYPLLLLDDLSESSRCLNNLLITVTIKSGRESDRFMDQQGLKDRQRSIDMMMSTQIRPRRLQILFVLFFIIMIDSGVASEPGDYACNLKKNPELSSFPFCDTSLSDRERVEDLVSRLTLEEKLLQLVNKAANISRLGVPGYQWWNEALHGVARSPGVDFNGSIRHATSFPAPILTSATFNTTLWNRIGQVVSTEARAMYNEGRANLTYWTPNINIVRDPRWGRAMETSGEDPLLTSVYAIFFVRGMQEGVAAGEPGEPTSMNSPGQGPHRLKVSACCKHYIAYDMENWEGIDRHHHDAKVTLQDLEDSYNPPFQSCIEEGRASSLMCSYNRVNGKPSCASYELLTTTVRERWNLDGYIVSDCGALLSMYRDISYAPSPEDAVADALNAGMDVECGSYSASHGLEAVKQGKLDKTAIDNSLINQYLVRMRLGLFDGDPKTQQYGNLGPSDVCTQANQELALESARQGIVLLKNDGHTLPLTLSPNLTLAVVGPHATSTIDLLGNYHGIPCKSITPLQVFEGLEVGRNIKVKYSPGCNGTACENDDLLADAVSVSKESDAVVIFAGLSQIQEREKLDRKSLLLPGHQQHLVQAIAEIADGKPLVLVIVSGGPVDLSFTKEDDRIQSILWVGYPGEAGGQAIAEVIFGDHNPGGRTPVTWYPESYTCLNMTDMHMRPNATTGYPGRTYRFHTQPVVYEFGHGLSYSTFEYRFASEPLHLNVRAGQYLHCYLDNGTTNSETQPSFRDPGASENSCFQVKVVVKNNSSRSGHETVLLYSQPPEPGRNGDPLKQLVAFNKVHLPPNSKTELLFNLDIYKHLTSVQVDGTRVLTSGVHSLQVAEQTLQVIVSRT